jgi:hypothetical protein
VSTPLLIAALGALFAAPAWGTEPIELIPTGYLQTAAVVFDQSSVDALDPDTRAPLNETRVLVRRARLGVRLTAGGAYAAVELDANTVRGMQTRATRALAGIQVDADDWAVAGEMGLMATPFGGLLQRSSRRRATLERTTAERALFPGTHDLGAQVRGRWRFLRYQIAAMNGVPISANDFAARDPNANKDLIGRVGVDLDVGGLAIIGGSSLLVGEGFSPGTASTKDAVQWQDGNQNGVVELTELQPIPGAVGRAGANFDRSALGLDLMLTVDLPMLGRLEVEGELFWAVNLDRARVPADPVTLGRDLRELGLMASVTQQLTPHTRLALRWDCYDPDADATERIAANLVALDRSVTTWTAALAWTTFAPFTLSAQYDHEDNRRGRGADGRPAHLANDRLTIWAQVTR